MKKFWIQGTIINEKKMNDEIMKEHMAYTQKAMESGRIIMSGLKADYSGGICMMIANDIEEVNTYLIHEPLAKNNIQEYSVVEFDTHFLNLDILT